VASTIWEFFGYQTSDSSSVAISAVQKEECPIIKSRCEKTFNDGVVSGVCTLKQIKGNPVICCPIRLYADDYRILREIATLAFGEGLELVAGGTAKAFCIKTSKPCIAVFGKRWGGELRLPQRGGRGSYFVDWVLARLNPAGILEEFIAVEVQTIDTTGNYRNGFVALKKSREIVKTTAGLNWENVSKRILPQLIYKGQVLQREELCKKGLFFVCPDPVFRRIEQRLGGNQTLHRYPLQPASITFLTYNHDLSIQTPEGSLVKLQNALIHSTTVYKVQEALVVEHAFASLNVGQLLLGKGGQWRHNRLWELSQ
jgi:hypothetical protein